MKPESEEKRNGKLILAKILLGVLGWHWIRGWRFLSPSGSIHNLSAADLNQIERIEKEGLLLVDGDK